MFCPLCGKEVVREDWRCEGCGSDLRRVMREEYWGEIGGAKKRDESGDRFVQPDIPPIIEGWRSMHKERGRGLLFLGIGSAVSAVLILLLYFAFRKNPTPGQPAKGGNAPVVTQAGGDNRHATPHAGAQTPAPAAPKSPPAVAPTGPGATDVEVKKRIEAWSIAWQQTAETKKMDVFASYYADDFRYTPSGKSKSDFIHSRAGEAKAATIILIENGEPKIKEESDRITVSFSQTYMSDRFSDAGLRTLVFAKRSPKLLIVSEDFADQTPDAQISPTQLSDRIMSWRKAWEELPIKGDASNLKAFYDPDFKTSSGRPLNSLLDLRLSQAKKSTVFAIDISSIQPSILGDRAVVSFKQTFKSDTFSDEGIKILAFHLVKGKLFITTESFRPIKKLPALKMDKFWGQ